MILSIETSCDETSVAIVQQSKVLCNIVNSQYFHSKYGGVVPELASRSHLEYIYELTQKALLTAEIKINQITAIAVTSEPGLIGALLVGSNFAKGLAIRYRLPVIPVNHIEGHIFSGFLLDDSSYHKADFPFVTLVVSGGHTIIFFVENFNSYKIIGSTRDDAAGEAFDKIGKLFGLKYPSGPIIDKLAKKGNKNKYNFPRAMLNSDDFDFSFSGLKTSVRYFLQKEFPDGIPKELLSDIAASAQSAIVDVLVSKTINAAIQNKVNTIVISGGVSANSHLRDEMSQYAEKNNIKFIAPSMKYCIDNAAMIGYIAEKKFNENPQSFYNYKFTVSANSLRSKVKK